MTLAIDFDRSFGVTRDDWRNLPASKWKRELDRRFSFGDFDLSISLRLLDSCTVFQAKIYAKLGNSLTAM